jgi:hypothetical protein
MSYVSKGTPIEVETATPGPGGLIEARDIGPHGPTGPMHPVDVDFMRRLGPHGPTGPLLDRPMEWARAIGPRGATGPLIPLEGIVEDWRAMSLAQKLIIGGLLGGMFYLASRKMPERM